MVKMNPTLITCVVFVFRQGLIQPRYVAENDFKLLIPSCLHLSKTHFSRESSHFMWYQGLELRTSSFSMGQHSSTLLKFLHLTQLMFQNNVLAPLASNVLYLVCTLCHNAFGGRKRRAGLELELLGTLFSHLNTRITPCLAKILRFNITRFQFLK